ncbi:MAG: patatin-like phospholipase family protein [Gammaproteobacteria bacterium]|nr:patatin-like phospholipase family protein [Gammaproteobacteria bacterium]MCP5423894.1 patatin-like phospholipase family protein [Gammaproteobacteria bacterium]
MARTGLVLTGGGARAAYQAGVLKGIAEIIERKPGDPWPFPILVGSSAGAINSSFVASQGDHSFSEAVGELCRLWQELRTDRIIRTDLASLSGLALSWLKDLSLGGLLGESRSTHLLDTRPLQEFLTTHLNFKAIAEHLKNGRLHGVAVSATNYQTGSTVVFFDGSPTIQPWFRSTRVAERTELTLRHVMASAAIPIFFRPVPMNGSFYGDGCVRLNTPLSPAIHLGADRILVIGIRYRRSDELTLKLNRQGSMSSISLVDIAGVMLNAAFLDALEMDIERLRRINRTLELLSPEARERHPNKLRQIPLLAIQPSRDLGTLASEQFKNFSPMLRYLLKGIGASQKKGWDLLSYLAFDEAYTGRLIELGYQDALAQREEILPFFAD